MPIKILMPALSPTMTEGNLAKWLKKEGEKINPGDIIAEIETDKATMEVESAESGILAKIIFPEGSENIAVNSVIAILLEEGEDATSINNLPIKNNSTSNQPQPQEHYAKPQSHFVEELHVNLNNNAEHRLKQERVFASPLAKRLAQISDINLSQILGSGPRGRIVKSDVLNAKNLQNNLTPENINHTQNQPEVMRNNEAYKEVSHSNIRKIIAKRLLESKQNIPHFYLNIECNMDKLIAIREEINAQFAEDKSKKISVNDFVILAAAKALNKVPEANSSFTEAGIRYYNNVDISVAVAIDSGLITPIINNADQRNLSSISSIMKDLIKRARENKLKPEEFQGGNFSISNLGMYGIKNFNAIINPPQSCILAIGASNKKPIIVDDQIKIATMMECTLSCDHRVVDGAVGANFLNEFKKFIESPILLLI